MKNLNYLCEINHEHIRYLDVRWYNNSGIILLFDTITKEYKSYISGEAVNSGNSEYKDILKIAAHGSTFPIEAAQILFGFDMYEDLTLSQSMYFV